MRTSLVATLAAAHLIVGCGDDDPTVDAAADVAADAACPEGYADCDGDGSCESNLDEPTSCGACDNICGAGSHCEARRCQVADAGTDAGDGACGARLPFRPMSADPPEDQELVFVLRDLGVDQRDRAHELGWNLDGQCTVADEVPLCSPPGAPSPPLDGDGGRDNVFGATVLDELVRTDASFPGSVEARMAAGEALLVHLSGWNGADDDPVVDVWMAQTVDVVRSDGVSDPQWDGADVWNVSRENFVGLAELPVLRDDRAYVAGRTLVARLPDREEVVLPFFDGGSLELRLTAATLVGTLSADAQRLEGVLVTGRFALIDLQRALDRAGICPGTELRTRLEGRLVQVLDVRSAPGTESPGSTCDALSVALPLTGFRAGLGEIVEPPPPPFAVCTTD